jgi:hypothetical protein
LTTTAKQMAKTSPDTFSLFKKKKNSIFVKLVVQ